jgi:hypothetical protein
MTPRSWLARSSLTVCALSVLSSAVSAEDCGQYPPGPTRFECTGRDHPGLVAKRERCMEEARQMGLRPMGGGGGGGGGLKGYVQECMRRR